MPVSIIIPTRNRSTSLARCLDAVIPQIKRGDEVTVVDNASTDNTKKYMGSLKHIKQLRYVYEPNIGPSYARNHGYKLSKNTIIAFLDDDCEAASDWLDTIKAIIASGGSSQSVYLGKIIHRFPSLGLLEELFLLRHQLDWQQIMAGPLWKTHRKVDFLHAGNVFASKTILSRISPLFDEIQFPFIGEERDLACRLQLNGVSIQYVPTVSVIHHKTTIRFLSSIRIAILLGVSQGKLRKRYFANNTIRKLFKKDQKEHKPTTSIYGPIFQKYKYNPIVLFWAMSITAIKKTLFYISSWFTFTFYKEPVGNNNDLI
jgi:glycosyltransferase involved in cell wall biosynthesis